MNGFDLSTIQDAYVGSAHVSAIYYGSTKIWPTGPQPHDYSRDYLTFEAIQPTTFTFTQNALQYSLDNGTTWTTLAANTATPQLAAGDKILWKQTGLTPQIHDGIGRFSATGNFNAYGNIMSLLFGDNFYGEYDLTGYDYAFERLFGDDTTIINNTFLADISNLILPATTLSHSCYSFMFFYCSSITTPPVLPATTLAYYCYDSMFMWCSSLTSASLLPATTLATYCYNRMFAGCTSLTTPPALPATTLAERCYESMFTGCTSLTTPPALPATTLTRYCYDYMFNGCTSLTTAPELLAITLASGSYNGMFCNCSSLNYIKCLATNISANNCLTNWVDGVASSGTFVRDASMTDWTIGIDGIPTNWTVDPPLTHDYSQDYLTIVSTSNNNTIGWKASNVNLLKGISVSTDGGTTWTIYTSSTAGTTLATLNNGDKLLIKGYNTAYGSSSYYNYFISTDTFNVEGNIMSLLYGDNFIGQTTLDSVGYNLKYLFNACDNLVSAEHLILHATTLSQQCYRQMFRDCTSLTAAPALPATTLAQNCYGNMFQGCTSLTAAPALPATTLAQNCYANMFNGCTSLTAAPALPATTLAQSCYQSMFSYCTSLTTAPELLATTLASGCYNCMFYNSTSLNYIKCLATDISASGCTTIWLNNVAASGTFVKDANTTWPTGTSSGIPSNWTVQNA